MRRGLYIKEKAQDLRRNCERVEWKGHEDLCFEIDVEDDDGCVVSIEENSETKTKRKRYIKQVYIM
jgi:hypothetical protein